MILTLKFPDYKTLVFENASELINRLRDESDSIYLELEIKKPSNGDKNDNPMKASVTSIASILIQYVEENEHLFR